MVTVFLVVVVLGGAAWTAARVMERCPATETPTRVSTLSDWVGIGGRAFWMRPSAAENRFPGLFPSPLLVAVFGSGHGIGVSVSMADDHKSPVDIKPICIRATHKGETIERPVELSVRLPNELLVGAAGSLPQWSEGFVRVEFTVRIDGRYFLIDLGETEIQHHM
jgi:hypothetical protein